MKIDYRIWETTYWEDIKELTYDERVDLCNLQEKENLSFSEAFIKFKILTQGLV